MSSIQVQILDAIENKNHLMIDYSCTRLVWYSDGCCGYLIKFKTKNNLFSVHRQSVSYFLNHDRCSLMNIFSFPIFKLYFLLSSLYLTFLVRNFPSQMQWVVMSLTTHSYSWNFSLHFIHSFSQLLHPNQTKPINIMK